MFALIRQLLVLRKLKRQGRAAEVSHVLQAMEGGATFDGAKGVMLLSLAGDRRWVEMNMRMNHHNRIPDHLLGEAWARRLDKHIKATRTQDLTPELERLQ